MALLAALCCTIVKGRDNMCNVWLWHAMACYGHVATELFMSGYDVKVIQPWPFVIVDIVGLEPQAVNLSKVGNLTPDRVHMSSPSSPSSPSSWLMHLSSWLKLLQQMDYKNHQQRCLRTGTNGHQRVPTHHELNDLPFRHLMEVMAHWVMGCHRSLLVVVRYRGKKPGGILQARIKALVTVRTSTWSLATGHRCHSNKAMEVS